jgi:hypothetical protein
MVVVGEMWATGLSSECFRWRDVGDRFGSGGFSLERCRRQVCGLQVWIGSWESWIVRVVVVGNLWGTGSDQLSCCWRHAEISSCRWRKLETDFV